MTKRAVMHDAREIVVALNATNQAADALDVAIDAASALEGRLSALFIQDEQLLRLAELPFAALVGPTGELRPLPSTELELSLRMAAQNARSRLEHAARLERLESSFRVVRGRLLSELRRSASSAALVVSTAGRLGSLGRGPGGPGGHRRGVRAGVDRLTAE